MLEAMEIATPMLFFATSSADHDCELVAKSMAARRELSRLPLKEPRAYQGAHPQISQPK